MPDRLSVAASAADGADSWTRREILQQPDTLRATQALLRAERAAIEAFLAPLLAQPDLRIVLTGAGTSAFIGDCLAATLAQATGRAVEAIPTTDYYRLQAFFAGTELTDIPIAEKAEKEAYAAAKKAGR